VVVPQDTPTEPFLDQRHDHDRCIELALTEAISVCAERGVRFTQLRRRVLEILWQSHKPLGAYSMLETLSKDGRPAAPPTVYRALEFLLEQGLVHRIASLNAFIGCAHPGHGGTGQFLICETCGATAEMNDPKLEQQIARSAAALGFSTEHQTLEVRGLCPHCRAS
jgi:Fur family zinc uptake transcriptional regulator